MPIERNFKKHYSTFSSDFARGPETNQGLSDAAPKQAVTATIDDLDDLLTDIVDLIRSGITADPADEVIEALGDTETARDR